MLFFHQSHTTQTQGSAHGAFVFDLIFSTVWRSGALALWRSGAPRRIVAALAMGHVLFAHGTALAADHDLVGDYAEALEGDENGVRSSPVRAYRTTRHPLDDMEALFADERGAMATVVPPRVMAPSFRDQSLEAVAKRPSAEIVRVHLLLEDPGFDFTPLQVLEGPDRQAYIDSRRKQLAFWQYEPKSALSAIGASDFASAWLVNEISFLIPAGRVADVNLWPEVRDLYLHDIVPPPHSTAYSGIESRQGIRTDTLIEAGYSGAANVEQPSTWTRVAIIESYFASNDGSLTPNLMANHVGFRRPATLFDICWGWSCPSWYARYGRRKCGTFSCSEETENPVTVTHGTSVASVLLGSIEAGQDGNLSGVDDRRRRSGQAPHTRFRYYRPTITALQYGIRTALEDAVEYGARFANFSVMWPMYVCEPSRNVASLNGAIRNATDAGTVIVSAAGNEGHVPANGCTMEYFGWRTEVISVGALNTANSTTEYLNTNMAAFSARGGVPTSVMGLSSQFAMPAVGLVAPGRFRFTYTTPTADYDDAPGAFVSGTSFAAPAVTGAGVLLRQAFEDVGFTGTASNARRMITNLLLLGDTWNANNGLRMTHGVSDLSGFGRLRAYWPASQSLGTPWRWISHPPVTITANDFLHFPAMPSNGPVSSNIRHWKAVLVWYEDDLLDMSDIGMQLWDTCPPGGGNPQWLRSDNSFFPRKRIVISDADLNPGGRCLEVRVFVFSGRVPQAGKQVFVAQYGHGNDPSTH